MWNLEDLNNTRGRFNKLILIIFQLFLKFIGKLKVEFWGSFILQICCDREQLLIHFFYFMKFWIYVWLETYRQRSWFD